MIIVYTVNFGLKGRRKMTAHRLLSVLQIHEVFTVYNMVYYNHFKGLWWKSVSESLDIVLADLSLVPKWSYVLGKVTYVPLILFM